jgi:hypothetical protein
MSKLEDIPRKDFFIVPEGYFGQLPAKIQQRIGTSGPHHTLRPSYRYGLIYALPLFIVAMVVFFSTRSQADPEAMLASVETADLIHYLQESEITTEEMLESIDLSLDELDALEDESYDLRLQHADVETLDSELNSLVP